LLHRSTLVPNENVATEQNYSETDESGRIIPLMGAIAICSNLLIGYGARNGKTHFLLLLALPFIVSISFFLISDIDSPRGGIIRVRPENLISLSQPLHTH